jgi:hypothetical protein
LDWQTFARRFYKKINTIYSTDKENKSNQYIRYYTNNNIHQIAEAIVTVILLIKTTFNKKKTATHFKYVMLKQKTKPTEQHLKYKSLQSLFMRIQFFVMCGRWKLISKQFWKLFPHKTTSLLKTHAIKLIKITLNGEVYILVFIFCKRYSIWIKKKLCSLKYYNIYSIQFFESLCVGILTLYEKKLSVILCYSMRTLNTQIARPWARQYSINKEINLINT